MYLPAHVNICHIITSYSNITLRFYIFSLLSSYGYTSTGLVSIDRNSKITCFNVECSNTRLLYKVPSKLQVNQTSLLHSSRHTETIISKTVHTQYTIQTTIDVEWFGGINVCGFDPLKFSLKYFHVAYARSAYYLV